MPFTRYHPAMTSLRIRPFAAVHPRSEKAAQVACVPYDVIDTAEARSLAEGKPMSFLHVIRSEIDLPESTNPYDDAVYAKAKENLQRFLDEGVLIRDDEPGMFIYRQVMDHREQFGLVCCCHVDDYMSDIIKKHEKTRQDKEDDRTRHVLTLNANAEPVFLTYREQPAINTLVTQDTNERPLFHFNAPDGVTHTIWRVADPQQYIDAFAAIDAAYIADGHHRSASAARAGAERCAANPNHTGEEEYNWFLTVLFPHSQLQILPYNRVVKDLAGKSPQQVFDDLGSVGDLQRESGQTQPDRAGRVCIYLDNAWHTLTFPASLIEHSDPINSLDVSLLQSRVLEPVLGIGDPRTDKRIDFVGGIRGTGELEQRVNSGRAAIAFSMNPTSIEQLLNVSDAGMVMPPKSTWFEPKLRSGLLVHSLD
jgi:uncharacterized protein (DUF1015 family)